MDYRWSEKDFLARRGDQSPVLCGEGFITGWQFVPTQNGVAAEAVLRKTSCLRGWGLWVEGVGRGKGMCGTSHPMGSQTVPCPKGLGSYRGVSTWELDIEVMSWMCQALRGSIINPHFFSE